jgi:hypothetical protein
MADLKISALTSASTPLAGTEVLPIVQSGSTVKVSVANLTAGREFAAKSMTLSGDSAYGQGKVFTTNGEGLLLQAKTGSFFDAGMLNAAGNAYAYTVATGTVNMKFWGDTTIGNNSGQSHTVNGNLVIATSGQGIDFSATPGTGTSELLADYEEGTWTPGNGTNSTVNSVSSAFYTKVGRIVNAYAYFNVTTTSASITITGLPFNCTGFGPAYIYFAAAPLLPFTGGSYVEASAAYVNLNVGAIGTAAIMVSVSYMV